MKNYTILNQKPQNRFIDRVNLLMLGSIIAIGAVSSMQGCTAMGGASVPTLTANQSVIVECDAATQAVDAAISYLPKMTDVQVTTFNAAVKVISPICTGETIPSISTQQADVLSGAVFSLTSLNKTISGK